MLDLLQELRLVNVEFGVSGRRFGSRPSVEVRRKLLQLIEAELVIGGSGVAQSDVVQRRFRKFCFKLISIAPLCRGSIRCAPNVKIFAT